VRQTIPAIQENPQRYAIRCVLCWWCSHFVLNPRDNTLRDRNDAGLYAEWGVYVSMPDRDSCHEPVRSRDWNRSHHPYEAFDKGGGRTVRAREQIWGKPICLANCKPGKAGDFSGRLRGRAPAARRMPLKWPPHLASLANKGGKAK
jgi:hypothetical protein